MSHIKNCNRSIDLDTVFLLYGIDLFAQRGKVGIKDLSVFYELVVILLMLNYIGTVGYGGDELAKISLTLLLFLYYWNLAQMDGQWKAINLYKMDQYPDQKDQYYLVGNGEMKKL